MTKIRRKIKNIKIKRKIKKAMKKRKPIGFEPQLALRKFLLPPSMAISKGGHIHTVYLNPEGNGRSTIDMGHCHIIKAFKVKKARRPKSHIHKVKAIEGW